ncbi:hypothetical protein WICPIJ_003080 [Wickerhamomyces pijperi]|uniref:Major facilitator superfamily (MFS) profile domain-containing protein n=1 Tax=Wickerhamomyces pijperi TaxID=599730 RepID=A0A9P8Q7Z8_WICPI|nr:hypothetical protein WICPIJ_003080 [Wickerhamomyces pijperi]
MASTSSHPVQVQHELDQVHTSSITPNVVTTSTSKARSDPFQQTTEFEIDPDTLEDIDNNEYPEGGTKAYLTVFGSFMGLIPAFGFLNSIGAIQTYISEHQLADVSPTSISWIFSLFTFFLFASGIFSGSFFDHAGAVKPLVIGSILMCGGILATANANTVWEFVLSFGIVTGFGNGILLSPLVGVVAHYFKEKRATWTSAATTGGSVGGIIIPLILKKLYVEVGFAWALRILALIFAACLCIAVFLARERIKPETSEENTDFKTLFKIYVVHSFDYRYLFELKFVACALGVSFSEASLVTFTIYFPTYAIKRGFTEATAYTLITIMNTTGILGRYIPGYVADKWVGRFNVMIITVLGCCAASLCILLPFGGKIGALYAYAAIYGFLSGSVLSLPPVCCGQISKTEEFGKRYSTMYVLTSFTVLALVPIGGLIVGAGEIKDYNNFIIFTCCMFVVSVLCYFTSKTAVVGFRMCKF